MYNFKYHSPHSINESQEIYKNSEFPKYLAGGMTLIPSIKQKLSNPSDLIDLQNISELKQIKIEKNKIIIGALSTHNQVANSDIIIKNLPGLSYLASNIADNAVRNLGTIGGSISNADPAADYPAALLSLDAIVNTSNRNIKACNFFLDMFETTLENDEIVKSVTFPIRENSYYLKYSSQASKYAIIGIFSCKTNDYYNVAVTGASNKVFVIEEISRIPISKLQDFNYKEIILDKFNINSDIHASASYRISLIRNLIYKTLKI